jgi:uncharacterized integral membrane protein
MGMDQARSGNAGGAVLGALVAFAFVAARIIQLRLRARRVSREPSGHGK